MSLDRQSGLGTIDLKQERNKNFVSALIPNLIQVADTLTIFGRCEGYEIFK